MQAEPRSLIDSTMLRRESILSVPFGHGIDHALAPTYLRACVVKNGLAAGDVIELCAHDFSWIAKLLIVSVNKAAWSATTRLLMAPTFLLGSADHSPLFIVDQLNVVEQDYRQGKMSAPKYEDRNRMLMSLRDQQRYPSRWFADRLGELDRALDAQLLTRQQHGAATLAARLSKSK